MVAKSFEQITANISLAPRRELLGGREFVVVPVTMIVPGVLNGSQGPLLYPLEEIEKDPASWNSLPLTLGHPSRDGKQISARSTDPAVNRIGTVENCTVDGKLKAEAWIDVLLANQADSRILPRVLRREPLEISTGLWTDNESAKDIPDPTFKGVTYTHIARNYRPDHLAVLLDVKGACSTEDGCGLNVNKEKPMNETERKTIVDLLINSCCWEEGDRKTLNSLPDDNLKRLKLKVEEDEAVVLAVNTAVGVMGIDPKLTMNELPDAFKAKGKQDTKAPAEKVEAGDEEDDEEMEKNKKKSPTANAPKWEDIAPAEVLEDLAFARNEKAARKKAIVDRLTANIEEPKKATQVAVYNEMGLEQLEALDPGVPEPPQGHPADYTGNQGGLSSTPVEAVTNLKPLPSPTIDYASLSPLGENGHPKE